MRRSDLLQTASDASSRTTQIVFGARQHLLRVLDSLEGSNLPPARRSHERRVLEELIHARTKELNEINELWDQKVGMVLSAEATPDQLEKLAKQAPRSDFYLLRLISEHPKVTSKTLGRLAKHPYGAIRENVARHPNADPATLALLSRDRSQPLWYLVAFNPNTPGLLRRKLQERLRNLGQDTGSK
jgi:Leucine rich repeat variant